MKIKILLMKKIGFLKLNCLDKRKRRFANQEFKCSLSKRKIVHALTFLLILVNQYTTYKFIGLTVYVDQILPFNSRFIFLSTSDIDYHFRQSHSSSVDGVFLELSNFKVMDS